jgi:LAS superfamily LD-carboxypeptidase LdcB
MPSSSAKPLSGEALTGRCSDHVEPLPGGDCRLHPEAIGAFLALQGAAREAGLELQAVSGFRDLARQLAIWNGKFRGERPVLDRHGRPVDMAALDESGRVDAILVWSALPGASRHHWGSDFDVVDAATVPAGEPPRLEAHDFAPAGRHARLADWLDRHAARFGFFRPYDVDRGGTSPEPWHLSYAPVAGPALAAMSPRLLAEALAGVQIEGRATIERRLPSLFQGYVAAVAPPPAAALAAAWAGDALSRASRPA